MRKKNTLKMSALIGNIGTFDESVEQWSCWSSYTERTQYFVLANGIKAEVVWPTFLTVMGGKTFNLLHSLVMPEKPGDESYLSICIF